MKISAIASLVLTLISLSLSGCESQAKSASESHEAAGHHEHKILVTSPVKKTVISTQKFVCQIHKPLFGCKDRKFRAPALCDNFSHHNLIQRSNTHTPSKPNVATTDDPLKKSGK